MLLHKSSNWHDRVIRESVELSLKKGGTLNQEEGVFFSKAPLPALPGKNIVTPLRKVNDGLSC